MTLLVKTNNDRDSFHYFCYYCGTHGIPISVKSGSEFFIECNSENYKDLENLALMYNFQIEIALL